MVLKAEIEYVGSDEEYNCILMNTEFFSFLSAGGLTEPRFFMVTESVQFDNSPEVEWKNILGESESYSSQFKNWWNSSTPETVRNLVRGGIIATSVSLDSDNNSCLLIDYFLEKKRNAFPFIKNVVSGLKLKEIHLKKELATLLTISVFGERFALYNDNLHLLQQFICLNSEYRVRIYDEESKQEYVGIVRKPQYIDFQFYYFLQPDSSELAEHTIQFGVSSFREIIFDRFVKSKTVVEYQQEIYTNATDSQHKMKNHNNPAVRKGFQSHISPSADNYPRSAHPYANASQNSNPDSNRSQINTYAYNPLRTQPPEAGADSIPLNEVRPDPLPSYGLTEGCSVKVKLKDNKTHFGTVCWVGTFQEVPGANWALIEDKSIRDDPLSEESKGVKYGKKIGLVKPGHGLFIPAKYCEILPPDGITCEQLPTSSLTGAPNQFDKSPAFVIRSGFVPPIKVVQQIIGVGKGIQGLNNSCYMDASLFGMFCFNERLDDIFLKRTDADRDANPSTERYQVVQKILKERIVYPLRKEGFVRADQIQLLRYKLDEAGVVDGLLGKEKDPEEFLTCLLQHVLNVQPYLKIRGTRNEDGFFFQIFTSRKPHINLPTVQLLLEHAFNEDKLMLAEVPQFFLLQMPRHGKHFRLYPQIIPSLTLDISNLTQSVYTPKCVLCSLPALYRCHTCEKEELYDYRKVFIYYCHECVGMHCKQTKHKPAKLEHETKQPGPPSQLTLFAVLTIELAHYVCFAKCGKNPGDWVMFDSMHDRIEDGDCSRNIPNVIPLPDLEKWLSDPNELCRVSDKDSKIPDYVKRLTRDVSICMYYSDVSEIF